MKLIVNKSTAFLFISSKNDCNIQKHPYMLYIAFVSLSGLKSFRRICRTLRLLSAVNVCEMRISLKQSHRAKLYAKALKKNT